MYCVFVSLCDGKYSTSENVLQTPFGKDETNLEKGTNETFIEVLEANKIWLQ